MVAPSSLPRPQTESDETMAGTILCNVHLFQSVRPCQRRFSTFLAKRGHFIRRECSAVGEGLAAMHAQTFVVAIRSVSSFPPVGPGGKAEELAQAVLSALGTAVPRVRVLMGTVIKDRVLKADNSKPSFFRFTFAKLAIEL